jgi:hypothetical protein
VAVNDKCILVYGLNKEEIEKIQSQNIKIIDIDSNRALSTLEHIIQGDTDENSYGELTSNEKALIFYGFKEEQLKFTIRYIRGFVQGGVLAICTPQNYKWTFKYLLEHLIEEREWYKANGRK